MQIAADAQNTFFTFATQIYQCNFCTEVEEMSNLIFDYGRSTDVSFLPLEFGLKCITYLRFRRAPKILQFNDHQLDKKIHPTYVWFTCTFKEVSSTVTPRKPLLHWVDSSILSNFVGQIKMDFE